MSRTTYIRVFSFQRILLALVLGFVSPLTYLLTLFLIFYFTGKQASQNFVMLAAWPRVIWDVLVDQPRSEANVASGLLFIAICDTLVYGAIMYVILTAVSVIKPKTVVIEPPPSPHQIHPGPPNSD
jgi:hypothetical protein